MSGPRLTRQAADTCASLLKLAGYRIDGIARDWSIYGRTSYSIRFSIGSDKLRAYRTDQVLAAVRHEPFDFVP